jgi:ABC-type Mn2+/Zn2+ transport system permease subunit
MGKEMTLEKSSMLSEEWKRKALLIGALVGAGAGVLGAYLLIQRAEKEGQQPTLSVKEGVKLGALVFGLLRQVALLGQ